MPGNPAPNNAVFAQFAARSLLAAGHPPAAVFAGTGFSPALAGEEAPAASFAVIAAFFDHAATLTGDRLFGFRLGQGADLRSTGLLGYIAHSAATAGTFLQRTGRYAAVLSDVLEIDTSRLSSDGVFAWRCNTGSNDGAGTGPEEGAGQAGRQYVEFLAAALIAALRSAAGHAIAPQAVHFAHDRVRGACEIAAWTGAAVSFGQDSSCMVFERSDLARPLASADAMLEKVLCTYGDQILSRRLPAAASLRVQVERAVAARLSAGPVTLVTVAGDLGMSPRSLSRKLAQLETSYFTILGELRKSLALRYLSDSKLGLAEIAHLLGYSGLSSFNDAFKRWTGRSPGQYRAGQAGGSAGRGGDGGESSPALGVASAV